MANWSIKVVALLTASKTPQGFVQQSTNVGMIIFGMRIDAEANTMGGFDCCNHVGGRAIGPACSTVAAFRHVTIRQNLR